MKMFYNPLRTIALAGISLLNSNVMVAQNKADNQGVGHIASVDPALQPFYHGVASGDPLSDAIIIWTRVKPDTGSTGAISVDWRMATDTNMSQIVKSGNVSTDADVDYTVKVDVTGLQPETYYYYEFTALGKNSLIGRTKTAPDASANVNSLRFAFVACSNYPYGYFNAYSAIKKGNDIDAVIHLGDYIYEYADGYSTGTIPDRPNDPINEIIQLADYRTRYSHYHLDPDLRKLHQQYPWMIIWDDHETANNSYRDGAENHDPGTEGTWSHRKSAGMRAWTEWLPVRKPSQTDSMQIYRKITYGDLAEIYLLDTRLFDRDIQDMNATDDTTHYLLGNQQRSWLFSELSNSTAQWKVLAQQVMMAPLSAGFILDNVATVKDLKADMWEGYNAERQSLMDYVLNNNIDNVVVITGDIHTSWANDIPTSNYSSGSPATGSAMVEFVTTSVTSPGLEAWLGSTINSQLATLIYPNNPHIKYVNLDDKGYNILDLNTSRTQSDFYFVNTVATPDDSSLVKDSWFVLDGERSLRHALTPTSAGPSLTSIPFAPENPHVTLTGAVESDRDLLILGTYPNPAPDYLIVQFFNEKASPTSIKILDVQGKVLNAESVGSLSPGLHFHVVNMGNLADGFYMVSIETDENTVTRKVLKGGK